ncbi:MAG TPA: 2-aminoethylphosphonate ABC transporter substrate-binding protein [Methylomirabilota bacterium]|jgi:2-aminoethylphosphonate transport system substrate-binding protein|nr:2-aminoethylphosphonate ABC transporter substrate-binding protein [Methylomirabilota bacterium]
MRNAVRILVGLVLAAALGAGGPAWAQDVVTIYSADGLRDGQPNWYQTQFDAFTKATGIKVQYVEGGSGVVVQRVAKEKTNPQADVLVTLPPFIQKAKADGLLTAFTPAGAEQIPAASKDPAGFYHALVNNYMNFIYNAAVLPAPPASFEALLDPKFKNKIQYSTPGQAGDGTAVMLLTHAVFGGKDAGFEYLRKLQANNRGPSSSTGKLTALVNKGELWVANGDMQMNFSQMAANPNIRIFWPAGPDGQRATFALPYYVGLVQGAPHAAAGKKLIEFLLSKEAQSTVSSIAKGLPVRQDIQPTDENYKQLQSMLQGVKILTPDWAKVLSDLEADVARWHEVTGS